MAVKAPDDKHFRRSRVRPAVRRRRDVLAHAWRVVRVALVAGLVVSGLVAAGRALVRSSYFTVQRLTVRGNDRLSPAEVADLLHGLRGQNILRADLAAWQDRLTTSPWVRSAELHRMLPSTVEVEIVERVPLAIGRAGDRLHLVDDRGEIIDDYGPEYAALDLPIVDGLVAGERDRRRARAALVGRLVGALSARPELLQMVSQIDVADPRDAVAILENDPARVHLGDREFVARLESYLELRPALRARVPVIDYVDLRFEARVFVRPAADTGAPAVVASSVREDAAFR